MTPGPLGEASRVLGGLASAFNYEKLRSAGWQLLEGWDKRAPHFAGLPVVREYRIRNASNAKAYITEPSTVTARGIRALVDLAASGDCEVVIGAASLYMPGEAVAITIRPRY